MDCCNFAYKWFCGLGLTEKTPDAPIGVNRTRRFRGNQIAEKFFQEISRQAMEKKLVGGEILYTDSTHVKAKANKHKKITVTIEKSSKAYMGNHCRRQRNHGEKSIEPKE